MVLKYEDLTGKIIGCAMTVHRKMDPGYKEVVYARCLAIEFKREGLFYRQEVEWPIYYDEFLVSKRRVDFFVEEIISVELKALSEIGAKELAQGLNYLESGKLDSGLLINFGVSSLQFKRLINKRL